MKFKIFRVGSTALLFLLFFMTLTAQKDVDVQKREKQESCLYNEEKAVEIAESTWLKAFGYSIYTRKPFIATLKDSSMWIVKGTLHSKKGGVPYIEIRRSDCKVLKITHGK